MKTYITTAIPYVNGKPHIGHTLEFVQADTLARFHRLLGDDVILLTGSDENSLKNVRAAEKEGISTTQLLDKYTQVWKEFSQSLDIQVDAFQRSFNPETHFPGVQELWKRCVQNGDIYKKSYQGLYCVGCERFYKETELVNGLCPDHQVAPELVNEENYFFKLSSYQEKIKELITSDTVRVIPEKIKQEVLRFIDNGLDDFSVSRSVERARGVGVPVPEDPAQVMYVWFDALTVYMTGIGYGYDPKRWEKYWPADVHVIGKDIVRFHAIYWIGMLLSAKLPLPATLWVHGHISSGGQKMSKSIGNVIDPYEVVKKYGTDFTRFYLLYEIPTLDDGDFTFSRATELYTSEFSHGIGNLMSRVAALCAKTQASYPVEQSLVISPELAPLIIQGDLRQALHSTWKKMWDLNKWLSDNEPWKLEGEALQTFLIPVVEQIRQLIVDLTPFLPSLSAKLESHFSTSTIEKLAPLFPKLVEETTPQNS
ncbi:methionine--tRNA ligase [Candidatus Woesebacteria bacterium]|nr:methionine--tRNA ligase [Candidatus Woesebacteria bacterium]